MVTPNAQEPESIRHLFQGLAPYYDRLNNALSLGLHHRWKSQLIAAMVSHLKMKSPPFSILDAATGTGDLAFRWEKTTLRPLSVTAVDFCPKMLEEAQKKAQQRGSQIKFQIADLLALPFPSSTFDGVTIAFGLRNTASTEKALQELLRVTRPGGTVGVLEFGQPTHPVFAFFFRWYARYWMPLLGGWQSGQRQAYDYLRTSSESYLCGPPWQSMAEQLPETAKVDWTPLQVGLVHLYCVKKKEVLSKTSSESLHEAPRTYGTC